MSAPRTFLLREQDIPETWYNAAPDLPVDPGPVLDPVTRQPASADSLRQFFPARLVAEMESRERWVEIPGPVRDVYKLWRPTPLARALRLEQALDTPAHLYYKFEGTSPVGSHKPNSSVPQAFYARSEGARGMITE